jgi:hypothetical protein
MVKITKVKVRDDFKITVPTLEEQYRDAVSFEGITELPPVGLEIETSVDNCNSVFSVRGILDNVTLPTVDIYIRNPYCRLGEPPPENIPVPTPKPSEISSNCNVNGIALGYEKYYIRSEDGERHRHIGNANCLFFQEIKIDILEWNYDFSAPLGNHAGKDYYYYAKWNCTIDYRFNSHWANSFFTSGGVGSQWNELGQVYGDEGWTVPGDYLTNERAQFTIKRTISVESFYEANRNATHVLDDEKYRQFIRSFPGIQDMDTERYQQIVNTTYTPYDQTQNTGFNTWDEPADSLVIDSVFGNRSLTLVEIVRDDFLNIDIYVYSGTYRKLEFGYPDFKCAVGNFPPPEPPGKLPPPPPPPMSCCPNVRENDQLLKLILQRIGTPLNVQIRDFDETTKGYQPKTENQETLFKAAKIATDRVEVTNDIIGISEYPITAPLSIVEDYKDIFPEGFDLYSDLFADADLPIQLSNLTQFINWQVEQESAVMGGWQQIISFEKDGKKDIVRLMNVAETLKELIIIQVGQNRDNSLIVDMCTRMLTELIQIKANVIKANYVVEDIQDYLDYPTNQKSADFPITITTPEEGKDLIENESVDRFLKPSTMKIVYDDWTGTYSLHEKLLDILQSAAIIRAANTETGEELTNYGKFNDGKEPPPGFDEWSSP